MDHKTKFEEFINACATNKAEVIIISHLGVIGDTVEEVATNLTIAAKFWKRIQIVEPSLIIQCR